MKKYFWLQSKRMGRYLIGAFLAALVLLGGLLAIFGLMVQQSTTQENNQKFDIAMVGYTDDPFLQMGLNALTAFDSSRFSLNILQMTTKEAQGALSRGEIAAYVVVPENFVDNAMRGEILPLEFVSTTGAAGLVSMFKTELTGIFSQILLSAQKGVFGMAAVIEDYDKSYGNIMDDMSIRYATYVFSRDKLYQVEELGIADALGFEEYLLCGLSVLFLLLCCLPYAPLMIRKDTALSRMQAAKGRPAFLQCCVDMAVYALALFMTLVLLLLIGLCILGDALPFVSVLLNALPVVILAAALSYMLFSLSTDLVGGILLTFFTTLALCFVSGCLYPVYFFPVQVQQIAAWLPTGLARTQLANCITGEPAGLNTLWLLMYSTVFFLVGSLVAGE